MKLKTLQNVNLTKNFSIEEFRCNDYAKTPVPQEYVLNALYVAKQLQKIRDHVNAPIKINSAYRTLPYNALVAGKTNSHHLTASAADIKILSNSMTNEVFYLTIQNLVRLKIIPDGEIIKYPTFVHYAPHKSLEYV